MTTADLQGERLLADWHYFYQAFLSPEGHLVADEDDIPAAYAMLITELLQPPAEKSLDTGVVERALRMVLDQIYRLITNKITPLFNHRGYLCLIYFIKGYLPLPSPGCDGLVADLLFILFWEAETGDHSEWLAPLLLELQCCLSLQHRETI